jgi:hypothetical protein
VFFKTEHRESVWAMFNVKKMSRYNGISKVILVKGGHGLENVCLNVFSVTISSVRTIGLPAPFL